MTRMLSIRIEADLLAAVDEIRRKEKRPRAAAFREALEMWVREHRNAELVEQHRRGYERNPVKRDEFSSVLGAQVWPK